MDIHKHFDPYQGYTPVDYTETFHIVSRLDSESTADFDNMMKFADRLSRENCAAIEDLVGELQQAINTARENVQKRIMDIYAKIAKEDV